jgi:hypothetical protein
MLPYGLNYSFGLATELATGKSAAPADFGLVTCSPSRPWTTRREAAPSVRT